MKTIRNTMMGLLLMMSSSAIADEYAYLTIDQTGTETSFAVSDVKRITFDESNMVLHLANGTEQKLPLNSLSKMFFSEQGTNGIGTVNASQPLISMKNGILRVTGGQGGTVTIYDMGGKAVRTVTANSGETELNLSGMAKGVYIVKVGSQTKKVMNEPVR